MALVETYCDGVNITPFVDEGSLTHRLNRPRSGKIRFPTELVTISDKSKIKIVLNGVIDAHGTVEGPSAIEVDGDEDTIWTTAEFTGPEVILDSRRAMDADGDYTNPTFMYDLHTGPAIIQFLVSQTHGQVGPTGLLMGGFAGGGADLAGAPTNWPMFISEIMVLLTDTGECDWYVEPCDIAGSTGILHAYNGNFGVDRTASVHFDYAIGSFNATKLRMVIDKSGLANRIRYLLGPRRKTALDPGSIQHWDGSIDRTTVAQLPAKWLALGEPARAQSELDHLIREDTRIFDAQGDSNLSLPRELYLYHWTREAWVRLKPRRMHSITPEPGIVPSFHVGDLITLNAGPRFYGGFSGEQRVMEYTYVWDSNGVVQLGAPVGQAGAAAVQVTSVSEGM